MHKAAVIAFLFVSFHVATSFGFVNDTGAKVDDKKELPNIIIIYADDLGSVSYTHLTLPTKA